jgi:predicted transcriptional regulator
MPTTIQVTKELKSSLDNMKLHQRETYNDVLERLIEDFKELNTETKRDIEKAKKEIRAGKFKTHKEVKRQMGF